MKKIFTFILAAAMAISMGTMSVSAENKVTEKIYGDDHGNVRYKKTTEVYKGILIKMPDGSAPTSDIPGLENCSPVLYKAGSLLDDGFGSMVQIVPEDDTTYFISPDEVPEEESEKFVRNLKIDGVVSTAESLYYTYYSEGYMHSSTKDGIEMAGVAVSGKNTAEITSVYRKPTENDKDLCGFKEFSEAGFTVNELYIPNEDVICYSLGYEPDKYESKWKVYEELKSVCDKINEEHAGDEDGVNAGVMWEMLVSGNMSVNRYSPELLWGDATDDGVIDLYDAIEIAKYLIKKSDMDRYSIKLADINRDGKTDLYDAISIAETLL